MKLLGVLSARRQYVGAVAEREKHPFQLQVNVSSRINGVWTDCNEFNVGNEYSSSCEQGGASVESFMARIQTASEMDAFMRASL